MGKRSNFPKKDKDFYGTVDEKVLKKAFLDHIRGSTYAEPCWGEGDLEDLLKGVATCKWRSDLRDTSPVSKQMSAIEITSWDLKECDYIITNPPFTKSVLLPILDHFISLKPTWLLLPADYMHNLYFRPYMDKCTKVVSIGRICWFPSDGKRVASTDNFCWYYWPKNASGDSDTYFMTGE